MFTWGPQSSATQKSIQFVAANADAAAPFSIPTHLANDFIIAIATSSVGAAIFPTVPAGWSTIASSSGSGFTNATRIYGIRDAAGTLTQVAQPGNTQSVIFLVYRNMSGVGKSAFSPNTGATTSGGTPSLGSLAAGSWIAAGMKINQVSAITGPANLTTRSSLSNEMASDSNGARSSYAGGDIFTWGAGAFFNSYALELLADA
jgi:hypothetical protein